MSLKYRIKVWTRCRGKQGIKMIHIFFDLSNKVDVDAFYRNVKNGGETDVGGGSDRQELYITFHCL